MLAQPTEQIIGDSDITPLFTLEDVNCNHGESLVWMEAGWNSETALAEEWTVGETSAPQARSNPPAADRLTTSCTPCNRATRLVRLRRASYGPNKRTVTKRVEIQKAVASGFLAGHFWRADWLVAGR